MDAGLSCRELMRRMADAGERPDTLDAILLTHEHADHVSGLPVLARKFNIPVYFTEATHRAWVRSMTPRNTMTYKQWIEQQRRERQDRLDAQALAHQIATTRTSDDRTVEDFTASDVPLDDAPLPAHITDAYEGLDASRDPAGLLLAAAAEDCDGRSA